MAYSDEDLILFFVLGFAASFLANYFYSRMVAAGKI